MDSTHFKNLFDTLNQSLVKVIKEKIGRHNIWPLEAEVPLLIFNPINGVEKKLRKIKKLTSESVLFNDDITLDLTEINDFNDLILILKYIEDWLEKRKTESIQIEWSIQDFEERATEIEERENKQILYDRAKFQFALKMLKKHHDCNWGITWDHIDINLNEYCTLDLKE